MQCHKEVNLAPQIAPSLGPCRLHDTREVVVLMPTLNHRRIHIGLRADDEKENGQCILTQPTEESTRSLRGAMYKKNETCQIALDQRHPRAHISKHREPVCQIADRYSHIGISA